VLTNNFGRAYFFLAQNECFYCTLVPVYSAVLLLSIFIAHCCPCTVLCCLESRLQAGELYTSAGSTIVAVNPLQDMPHLYTAQIIHAYHHGEVKQPGKCLYKTLLYMYTIFMPPLFEEWWRGIKCYP